MRLPKHLKIGFPLLVFSLVAIFSLLSSKAQALSGADFNASRIIDDTIFFNSSTQGINDVQAFLNAKVPSCDTWGASPSGRSGYPTRADWGRANGNPPPYACLRDYSQSIGTVNADSYCGGISGGTKSAANIIYDVSRACGVNTQALIVLLQKEQSLITDDWPWPIQYRSATGYGCPDTAACDSQYYGFFNQVYNAARQFKRYTMQPHLFNYASGRTSFIAYQANAPSCSGTNLTLQNGSTAALYNYTPYQPNAAALNNLYGTGDACSAYGNRNFWRMFNDWFGPTLGDLVRTPDNGTVYLISGNNKYPIADGAVLSDFMSLGPIRFVSNEYVGNKTTGPVLGHMVGDQNGTLYFVNAGIKLAFTSCDMVAQYGYTCAQVITLSDGQLSRLHTGPNITQLYGTTSGKIFYVNGGQKREVFDQASATAANISGGANTLLESGLNYLGYGAPVIRNNVVAASRTSGKHYYYESNKFTALGDEFTYSSSFINLPHNYLDDISIPENQRATDFKGFVRNSGSTQHYAITDSGKALLSNPSTWTGSFAAIGDTFLANSPTNSAGSINNQLIKSNTNPTVYYVTGGKKRPIPGWNDLLSLNIDPIVITGLQQTTVDTITDGPLMYGAGSLVKTPSSATVYMVKSPTELYPLTSFAFPYDMGLSLNIRTMSDSDLTSYTVSPTTLGNKIKCGSTNYVATNGSLHSIASNVMTEYGYSAGNFVDVGTSLCGVLAKTQALDRFISNRGTIYYVVGGQKRGFTSYQAFVNQGGNSNNTLAVSDFFADSIPNGSVISQ